MGKLHKHGRVIPLMLLLSELAFANNSITFESIPGISVPFEGLAIGTQFQASDGIVFELDNGTQPVLAKVGAPVAAFVSSFGSDTPAPNQGTGSFFRVF